MRDRFDQRPDYRLSQRDAVHYTLGTMIIVYGINSLYYDFVGRRQFLVLTVASLPLLRALSPGEFPSLLHHLLRVDCGGVRWVLWNKTRFGKNIFAIGGNPKRRKYLVSTSA